MIKAMIGFLGQILILKQCFSSHHSFSSIIKLKFSHIFCSHSWISKNRQKKKESTGRL